MGIIKPLERFLFALRIFSYSDIEISQEVEDKLKQKSFGGTFYLISNDVPLFINSNWKTIENRILSNDGNLKFAVYEKPKLPNFLLNNTNSLDKINFYQLNKIPEISYAIFYDKYNAFSSPLNKNKDRFYLCPASRKQTEDIKSFFEKAEKELTKIDARSCFDL